MLCKWCCNGNKAGSLITLGRTDSPFHICICLPQTRYSVPLTFKPTDKSVGCPFPLTQTRQALADCLAFENRLLLLSLSESTVVICWNSRAEKKSLELFAAVSCISPMAVPIIISAYHFPILGNSGSQKAKPLTKSSDQIGFPSTGFPSFSEAK